MSQWATTPISAKLFGALNITPTKQRLSLYVSDWQQRRILMKGNWADMKSLPSILQSLEDYAEAGRVWDLDHFQQGQPIGEYVTRMWRIVNLLDAVYMGWKDKQLKTNAQQAFLVFKQVMASKYHQELDILRHEQKEHRRAWQWKAVTEHSEVLKQWREVSPDCQKRLVIDLAHRFSSTVRKAKAKHALQDPIKIAVRDRPELFWFLEVIAPGRAMDFAHSTIRDIERTQASMTA